MLKSNLKFALLLIFALLLTNPNHDEFIQQVARYSFKAIKDTPEIQLDYEISSKYRKLSFEDKYAAEISHEFRKAEARNDLKVYNLLLFTIARFVDSERDFYFISILKFNISNFQKSFSDYKQEIE
jgi:hypothetical protein